MVSLTTARTAISVGLIIFVVLVGGWVFRRTVGVILRLFELVAMTVVALIAMYVVYELVHGWRRAG